MPSDAVTVPLASGLRARSAAPFADVRVSLVLALMYAVATIAWLAVGSSLPGGRWTAVHLFALGVLTNAILGFTHHFGRTLTRTDGPAIHRWTAVANLAIVLLLLGAITGARIPLVIGGTGLTVVVSASWWRLRRMRHAAIGARFGWVVRLYERAHGAFVHGALLGVLLGLGAFPGAWYVGARMAHLHANVLGWSGITLLATLVFFGPTLVRTPMEPDAAEQAARHLRRAATALSGAVLLLLLSGLPGALGTSLRSAAGLALAVFAWSATMTLLPVWRVARGATRSIARSAVLGVTSWLILALWIDVVIVLGGRWRWLDAIGAMLLAGVLAQAVLATGTYLAPILRGRTTRQRDQLRQRLELARGARAGALNLGVALAALTAAGIGPPSAGSVGLLLVGGTVIAGAALSLAPVDRERHLPSAAT